MSKSKRVTKEEIQKHATALQEQCSQLDRELWKSKSEVKVLTEKAHDLERRLEHEKLLVLHLRESSARWEERARTIAICELDKDVFKGAECDQSKSEILEGLRRGY